jgi:hypothetical protein
LNVLTCCDVAVTVVMSGHVIVAIIVDVSTLKTSVWAPFCAVAVFVPSVIEMQGVVAPGL